MKIHADICYPLHRHLGITVKDRKPALQTLTLNVLFQGLFSIRDYNQKEGRLPHAVMAALERGWMEVLLDRLTVTPLEEIAMRHCAEYIHDPCCYTEGLLLGIMNHAMPKEVPVWDQEAVHKTLCACVMQDWMWRPIKERRETLATPTLAATPQDGGSNVQPEATAN